jgi:hypothetical protein
VGWREWVSLQDVGLPWIKAKIDTGAQTSALHTSSIEEFSRGGEDWVRFTAHPWQRSDDDPAIVELPVHDRRTVRSSSGHSQDRLVVLMDVTLCGRTVTSEVTLTSRDEMVFRMLVGREALRQGFTVDPALSYLGGRPPKPIRRRNAGR